MPRTPAPAGARRLHQRRGPPGVQFGGEPVDVLGPSCHHQAVTATSDRVHHIIDDLRGADPVRHGCPVSVCPSRVPVGRGCLRQQRSQVLLEARFLGEVGSWRLSTELRTRMCGRSSMVAYQSLLDQCLRQPGLLPEPADPVREQVHPRGGVRLAPVSDQSAEERCPGR
jgi:hypothetical protein